MSTNHLHQRGNGHAASSSTPESKEGNGFITCGTHKHQISTANSVNPKAVCPHNKQPSIGPCWIPVNVVHVISAGTGAAVGPHPPCPHDEQPGVGPFLYVVNETYHYTKEVEGKLEGYNKDGTEIAAIKSGLKQTSQIYPTPSAAKTNEKFSFHDVESFKQAWRKIFAAIDASPPALPAPFQGAIFQAGDFEVGQKLLDVWSKKVGVTLPKYHSLPFDTVIELSSFAESSVPKPKQKGQGNSKPNPN